MSGPGPQLIGLAPARDPVANAGVRVLQPKGGAPGSRSGQRATFALMQRITGMVEGFRFPLGKPPADTDPTTLDTGSPATQHIYDWQEYFRVDNSRLQVYEDADEMDESTDEVSAALDTLADSSVNPEDGSAACFLIELDQGPYQEQAEAIFEQVTESLDLHRQAYAIARSMLKYGDAFCELVVDDSVRLSRLKLLPPKTMWRNEDETGNMMRGHPQYDKEGSCTNEPGTCAYDQREALNGRILAAFESWQVVHFRWNHRGSERYGRSLVRTARLVWKKLRACEEALVVARLQRAWMRFVHYVDTSGMTREDARAELMRYRQELTRRLIVDTQLRENPFEVTSDFYMSSGYVRDLDGSKFLPKMSKIEVLQGDHAVLGAMTDIEYLQNKLFASLRVPKAYLGFERDINAKATLTSQDIQYARILRRIQTVLSQGYKEIFDFALLLAGIDPTKVSYTVRWPAILVSDEERDAFISRMRAQSDAIYWQMGAPSTKYLAQRAFGWDDEAWIADLQDAAMDPPPRLKPMQREMPNDNRVQGTGEPTDADAAQAAANAGPATITDTPPDDFDQSKVTTQKEAAAASARGPRDATRGPKPRISGGPREELEAELAALREAGGDDDYDVGDPGGLRTLLGDGLWPPDYDGASHGLGGRDPLSPRPRTVRRVGTWSGQGRPAAFGGRAFGPRPEQSVSGVHGFLPDPATRARARTVRAAHREQLADALTAIMARPDRERR